MTSYYNSCPDCGARKLVRAKRCRPCYRTPRNPVELILEKVAVDEATDCLLFVGFCNGAGYGIVSWGGRKNMRVERAHRVMYEAFVGPIPEGLQIDHLCRVRKCVNPAHLEPVTPAENVRRGAAAITHCPHGHEYTPENTSIHRRISRGDSRECRTCCNARRERYGVYKRKAVA